MTLKLNFPIFVLLAILLTATINGCISEKTVTSGSVTVKYKGVSEKVASALAETLNAFLQTNTTITIILKKQDDGYEITIPTTFNNPTEIPTATKKLLDMLAMSLSLHVFGNEPVIIKTISSDGKTIVYTTRGLCDDVSKFACNIIKYTKHKQIGNLSVFYTSQISDEQAQKLGETLIEILGKPKGYVEIYVDKYDSDTFEVEIPTVLTSANELSETDKLTWQTIATELSRKVFNNKRVLLRLLNQNYDVIHTEIGTSP